MKLEMERAGQFPVNFYADTKNQCGVSGNYIIHYRVNIFQSSKHLDKNGFIIDNAEVHNYFTETYKTAMKFKSCELIAMEACEHFRKTITGLFGVTVCISGNPNAAWLKSSWQKGDF